MPVILCEADPSVITIIICGAIAVVLAVVAVIVSAVSRRAEAKRHDGGSSDPEAEEKAPGVAADDGEVAADEADVPDDGKENTEN